MYIYEAYLPLAGSALAVAGVVAFHEAGIYEYMYVGCMYVYMYVVRLSIDLKKLLFVGHFLAARWQGIKVTSYNIGYGSITVCMYVYVCMYVCMYVYGCSMSNYYML